MKKVLLVGSSSDIAKSLINENQFDFIKVSSKDSDFNILDVSTFPKIEKLDGIVYFPGTVNLRPFSNLRSKDFQNDYEINVLGLINIFKKLSIIT